MNLFSHCVLTASDERQADVFRSLLERRISRGLYPREIAFHVYPDPPGRVGSGGGTMWALHRLYSEIGYTPASTREPAPTVLILHAAGESRRLPTYAPEGKLFAPIPLSSSSIIPPVVLDAQISLFLKFPWEPGQVVVGSGDVVIDFDPSGIDRFTHAITGFAAPTTFAEGSIHGVYGFDPQLSQVTEYYQKAPEEVLAAEAAIEGTDSCALDIGIVVMREDYVRAYLELGTHAAKGAESLINRLSRGDARFELYLEQIYASLSTLTFEDYAARIAERTALSPALQRRFHEALGPFALGGELVHNCEFIHVGSVAEYPEACGRIAASSVRPFYHFFDTAELHPEVRSGSLVFNSLNVAVDGGHGGTVCVEGSSNVKISGARSCLVAGVGDLDLGAPLPGGFCLDGRETPKGPVVAIYHADDSFRLVGGVDDLRFCNLPLPEWLRERSLSPADLELDLASESFDLWLLPLFVAHISAEFLAGYLTPPANPAGWAEAFRSSTRYSLRELNDTSDPVARDERRMENRAHVLVEQLKNGRGWRTVPASDLREVFDGSVPEQLVVTARETRDPVLSLYRAETLRTAQGPSKNIAHARRVLQFVEPGRWVPQERAVKQDQIVWARAPVRLDLGGGWTDTPPYTNSFGGAVTNLAVNINGQPPIQAFVRPTAEPTITFHSIDLGERETIVDADGLRGFNDPGARFSLPRAACTLLGLDQGPSLSERLRRLGGGLELSILSAVPKGSGLGTSSVLGGVILAALLRFFGFRYTQDELFLSVLELEQMLTTGGGWQDQIGGITGGVKYIETSPGLYPHPLVHQLDPFMFEEQDYRDRITLYYTGVTRLAKNILQDVVSRINRREPAYLFTHEYLRALARRARAAISLRDYDALSRVIAESWRANKLIHESTTNDEIEALLDATRAHWSGVKLLGAGGGGFALFFSPTLTEAERLREVLNNHSHSSETARLVDMSLSKTGLEVSVS
jgi:galactokinase/mevalonate kinase-like predicted kinase